MRRPECFQAFELGGGPVDQSQAGTVTVFDPPRAVTYESAAGFISFELVAVDADTTRLVFLQNFVPGAALEPSDWNWSLTVWRTPLAPARTKPQTRSDWLGATAAGA